jgi:membrane associated rhomboid family serine protease
VGLLIPLREINPRGGFPLVTALIVAVNVGAFVVQAFMDPRAERLLTLAAGAVPLEILSFEDIPPSNVVPPPFTIFTSMFLHGGWLHLLGNMWYLWLFGGNVEGRLGRPRFLAFYFLAGTVGAVAQSLIVSRSTFPMIGASGAIAGVLGGYMLFFPHSRVVTLVPIPFFWHITPVRAWIFLGLWLLGQFFIDTGSSVAWMAHVGGFLAGVGSVRLFEPRRRPEPFDVAHGPQP